MASGKPYHGISRRTFPYHGQSRNITLYHGDGKATGTPQDDPLPAVTGASARKIQNAKRQAASF
ncbi:MAG: hypothetical protein EOM10_13625 [Opitutae bacterium]|nr:hypothetical protein [Opitutae bacterium]